MSFIKNIIGFILHFLLLFLPAARTQPSDPASTILAQPQADNFKNFNPRFEVFTLPGGTLGNSVQGIVQDSTGFVWFGSQGGLHRYDGQNIRTIRRDTANPKSIASDYIEYMFLDSRGILWLTHYTNGGVTAFDPITETAVIYHHDPNDPASLGDNTNSVVAEDRDGNIWVGGNGGLDRFDRKTGKFKHFRHDPADPRSLSFDRVRALYLDRQGTLWVGTGSPWDDGEYAKLGGLNRYDPKTETFTRYLHDPADSHSLANNKVRALLEDSRGNFWVGTAGDGLHLMNREKGTFTRLNFDPKNPGKLSQPILRGTTPANWAPETHVSSIFEDPQGRIWITAFPGGLNVYDPTSHITRHFEMGKNEGDLTILRLWQTFQTRDGVTWLCGAGGGGMVFRVKLQDDRFQFSDFTDASAYEDMGDVNAILKDGAGNVWVGFHRGYPLVRFDRKMNEAFPLTIGDAPGGAGVRQVSSLSLDREGFLWVGTDKGLFRRDPKTGKFRHYLAEKEVPWFRSVVQDRDGYIWVPDWNTGLYRLDPRTDEYVNFRHDPSNPQSIGGNEVRSLYMDAKGAIWAGGGGWNELAFPLFVDRLNPDGKTFTHFVKEKETGSGMHLTSDEQGNLWFVDNVGSIQKINPADGSRRKFKTPQLLFANVSGAREIGFARAGNGSFWVFEKELTTFDPETERFYTFGEIHGIPPIGNTRHSNLFVAADGEILIAGERGLLSFYPNDFHIKSISHPPELRITAFRLLGEPVLPGGSIGQKPVWQTTEIRLAHDQNVFSFSVACFDFFDATANQIEFMLEGYDDRLGLGWHKDLRDGETSTYVNVPPGDYTFRARGADSHGVWNMEGVNLKIKILPPWWKTWWAYLLYAAILAGIIYGLFTYARNRAQIRLEQERQKLEATAMRNQAEKLRELDEVKSRFFANVSHELRTPLTLMLGPVNSLLKLLEKEGEEKKLLQYIQRSALQLQKLINEILDLAKLEGNKLEVVEEPVHFYSYLKEQMAQFHSAAMSNELDFRLKFNADKSLQILLDKNKFEKIVHNFLSNALKFTPKGGKITLLVTEADGGLQLSVADTGRGVHPDDLPHVFDRFYQSRQPDAPTEGGTGIGLSLVKELAELLGGTVWVESEPGNGSVFYFKFPKKEAAEIENGELKIENELSTSVPVQPRISEEAPIFNSPFSILNSSTILIVEDNKDLREYLQFLLSDYNVLTAENGQVALDILNAKRRMENEDVSGQLSIDLIISDLMMPVMDGFQFLEKLKSDDRWRHLPFIMLTAKMNVRTKLDALRIGVDDYLTKPFQEEELKARIGNLLRNYRERVEMFSQSQKEAGESAEPDKPIIAAVDAEWLQEVEAVYAKHLSDSRLNVDFAAGKLNLSERQFNRRLKQLTGLTPNQYLQETRLQRAKDMLVEGRFATVKEVAFAVGFQDARYFSDLFEKHFGAKPSEMRK